MYENDIQCIIRAQEGDKFELENLIKNNNGLIWSIVRRFNGRGYELDDLYQIGCMGFIKAIKRFDTNFEVKLSTYAVPYMIGEIKRFIRDDGPIKISRSTKELGIKIKELKRDYQNKKGKEISFEELEKELNVSKEDIIIAIEACQNIESIENNSYTNPKDGKTISLLERLTSNKNEEEILTNKIVVKELIDGLDKRDKEIIMLRFFKERTQTEVAKIMGVTQVQISRLEKKILNNMKRKLIS